MSIEKKIQEFEKWDDALRKAIAAEDMKEIQRIDALVVAAKNDIISCKPQTSDQSVQLAIFLLNQLKPTCSRSDTDTQICDKITDLIKQNWLSEEAIAEPS